MERSLLILLGLASCFVIGCAAQADEGVQSTNDELVGGRTGYEHPSRLAIAVTTNMKGVTSSKRCSATKVASNALLTSRSCLYGAFGAVLHSGDTFTIRSNAGSASATANQVLEATRGGIPGSDLAIVVTRDAIFGARVPSAAIDLRPTSVGTTVAIVGAGCEELPGNGGFGPFKSVHRTVAEPRSPEFVDDDSLFTTDGEGGELCGADIGGGAYRTYVTGWNYDLAVAGVHTAVDHDIHENAHARTAPATSWFKSLSPNLIQLKFVKPGAQ